MIKKITTLNVTVLFGESFCHNTTKMFTFHYISWRARFGQLPLESYGKVRKSGCSISFPLTKKVDQFFAV